MVEEKQVLFVLGEEEYAVSITQVKEIINYSKEATRLPDTPRYIEGIISLRGKIIPVVNLAIRLNMKTAKTDNKRALIVETETREIGIVVDEVVGVIDLKEDAVEHMPMVTENEYIRGIGKEGNRLLILLDVDKLFERNELSRIGVEESCLDKHDSYSE